MKKSDKIKILEWKSRHIYIYIFIIISFTDHQDEVNM